jgi:hypothetical protein
MFYRKYIVTFASGDQQEVTAANKFRAAHAARQDMQPGEEIVSVVKKDPRQPTQAKG